MRLLVVLLALTATAGTAQTTRYVDPSGTDAGACTAASSPCRTVAYALAQSADGDTIQLAAGVYTEDGGLFLDRDVTLQGAGRETTIVQEAETAADADARIVTIPIQTDVTIRDLTLRHSIGYWVPPPDPPGPYAYGGGAIRNNSRLTLVRVTVTDNNVFDAQRRPVSPPDSAGSGAFNGGGIYNRGILYMEECLIQRNEAWQEFGDGGDGGGIANMGNGQLTIVLSSLRQNTSNITTSESAGRGGGLYNEATATVLNSEIAENRSGYGLFEQETGDGGGVYNTGVLTMERTLVWGNATRSSEPPAHPAVTLGDGGGLYNAPSGEVTLRQVEVAGNRTGDGGPTGFSCQDAGEGAGLYNAGTLHIEQSRISANVTGDGNDCGDNTRGGSGGGLYVTGPTTVLTTTIAHNETGIGRGLAPRAGDGAGVFVGPTGTLDLFESTVSENRVGATPFEGFGAALFVYGAARVVNSTISGNLSEANGNGGGTVFVRGAEASLDLVATTLTANRSATVGGLWAWVERAGQIRIGNALLAGNVGGHHADCSDFSGPVSAIQSFGHNLIGKAGRCDEAFPAGQPNANGDYVGTDAQPLDPVLGPLAANGGPTATHALDPGSPALDTGTCTDLDGQPVATDQRGFLRTAPCDIGAFECDALPTTPEPTADRPGTHRLTPAYPNPFNPRAAFTLEVARAQHVTVVLVDVLGRRVATLHDGPLAAGTVHRLGVEADGLASGRYLVRVQGETFREGFGVTLLK